MAKLPKIKNALTPADAAGAYQTVVDHAGTAGTARPSGAGSVLWRGTVDPTNAATNDLYLNTSTNTLYRYTGSAFTAIAGAIDTTFFVGMCTRVYRAAAAQTLTTATHTGILFDTEIIDDAGWHDTVTNTTRVTVNAAGRYRINGQIEYASSATGARGAVIWKNGVGGVAADSRLAQALGAANPSGTQTRLAVATGVVALAAGDYIELGAYQASGGNLDVTSANGISSTFLCVERVS